MHVTVPDIRRDVMKASAIVSELERNFTSTQTMVSDIHRNMLKGQEESDDRHLLVSDTRTLSVTQRPLTIVQTQAGSAT